MIYIIIFQYRFHFNNIIICSRECYNRIYRIIFANFTC